MSDKELLRFFFYGKRFYLLLLEPTYVRIALLQRVVAALHSLCSELTQLTWLILPVVICLFQRLSHASLSISYLYGKTANSSL